MQTREQSQRLSALALLASTVACSPPPSSSAFESSIAETSTGTPDIGTSSREPSSGTGFNESSDSDSADDPNSASSEDSGADVKLDVASVETDGSAGDEMSMCKTQLDIVFVMDVSTSMTGFFDALEQDILEVDQALGQLDVDADTHYGLVVFVDDTEIGNSGAAYIDAAALANEFADWNEFTGSNRQIHHPSDNGTLEENSLDSLYRAADEFQWRPAATTHRVVIHTTDASFWDGPVVQPDGVTVEHGYAETVERLRDEEIRVFAFASDSIGPVFPGLPSLDTSAGWFTPYDAMPAIPADTGGTATRIDDVLAGTVSLADAIPQIVEASQCEPYPPAG